MTKYVPVGEIEANSEKLLDDVVLSGEALVVTRDGRPIATVAPFESEAANVFGCMKGTITVADPSDDLSRALDEHEIAEWERNLEVKIGRFSSSDAPPNHP